MDKHNVDFTSLDNKLNSPKVFKYADVAHRIEKVAFDIVRFRDNEDTTQLWKIEDSIDGPVIVAVYDSSPKTAVASAQVWEAAVDVANNVNIFYKGEPVTKIAASSLGVPDSEVYLLSRWLPEKLAADEVLRTSLLKSMSEPTRKLLVSKYPELRG